MKTYYSHPIYPIPDPAPALLGNSVESEKNQNTRSEQKMKFCVVCENCEFESRAMAEAEFELYRVTELPKLEGAFVGDGDGGCVTICPECKEDALKLES